MRWRTRWPGSRAATSWTRARAARRCARRSRRTTRCPSERSERGSLLLALVLAPLDRVRRRQTGPRLVQEPLVELDADLNADLRVPHLGARAEHRLARPAIVEVVVAMRAGRRRLEAQRDPVPRVDESLERVRVVEQRLHADPA